MSERRNAVVVFSRDGCCLCDDALAVLTSLSDELSLDITVHDIDTDPKWTADYGMSIPVVFVNEKLAFKGRIDPARLRRRLKGGGILSRLSAHFGLGD